MFFNLLGWSLLGLIAGAIAGKVFKAGGDDPKLNLVIGVIGAVTAGVLSGVRSTGGLANFNAWTLAIAPVGAIALLLIWHTFRSFAARG
jgi:uncharacterized membrane protein YeaQ/YmgE (transglycosylase-associated protein family)